MTGWIRRGTLLALLLALSTGASAQDLSHDGNRWYEVEISVFTHEGLVPDNERQDPTRASPVYPSRLRPLVDAEAIYDIFGGGEAALEAALPAPLLMGPARPEAAGDFRLPNWESDPFIDLGPREFARVNRRLEESPNHRLLFSSSWRQPALSPSQSNAVFIRGGERYGEHNELEGGVLLNYSGGRLNLGINLWLNRFTAADPDEAPLWRVPPQPFPPAEAEAGGARERGRERERRRSSRVEAPRWIVGEMALLRQGENPPVNRTLYFDHPDFGVILEIRPYLLPLPSVDELGLD